jgi:hypothetical protein
MPRDLTLVLPPSAAPPPVEDGAALLALAARELGVASAQLCAARATRLSFDARARHRAWRLALRVWSAEERAPEPIRTSPPAMRRPGERAPRVVVIGSGPAGLFAALDLLAAGLNVTVLERGKDVRARRRSVRALLRGETVDPDSNYCFGEGGAGTYSDGKLYTRSGEREAIQGVLELLVAHGAPQEILISWRPHVGSNRLPAVVAALRATILAAGGEVRFETRAQELETTAGAGGERRVAAVWARDLVSGARARLAADAVVLAAGHSALDALLMARRAGARLVPKGFAMGVRAEHPQAWLDARQYGGLRGPCDLPASFYELTTRAEERGVWSFCMCPGGFIVPATTRPEHVVVNGMSLARRDSPFASSGIVVGIEPADWCGAAGERWGWGELLARARALGPEAGLDGSTELPARPEDDPLFGARLQLALERVAAVAGGGAGRAPAQRADCLAEGRGRTAPVLATSYRPGLTPVDLAEILPRGLFARLAAALRDFDRRLPGFASEIGQCLGVESRTSSPVRIARDPETLASPEVDGLYPAGEGAGYAGGIVSAALDGRCVAARIARVLSGA